MCLTGAYKVPYEGQTRRIYQKDAYYSKMSERQPHNSPPPKF